MKYKNGNSNVYPNNTVCSLEEFNRLLEHVKIDGSNLEGKKDDSDSNRTVTRFYNHLGEMVYARVDYGNDSAEYTINVDIPLIRGQVTILVENRNSPELGKVYMSKLLSSAYDGKRLSDKEALTACEFIMISNQLTESLKNRTLESVQVHFNLNQFIYN